MTRVLTPTTAAMALLLATSPALACDFKFCNSKHFERSSSTRDIRTNWNNGRVKIGDFYQPRAGARIQIRDNSRRILGYIETDGDVTNIHRQKAGTIESILGQ